MKITSVELKNFRNYSGSKIEFSDGLNFIVGANAQGKTNLLESIYLTSVGKSPKHVKDKQIIKFNETAGKIDLNFLTNSGSKNIKIYLDKLNKKSIKVNNLNVLKLTELVGTLSVVYFSPDELKLIKEVPEDRRTFLDISISQFDKNYLYNLLKYDKILRQRNTLLKSADSIVSKKEQLNLFTPQLIETAEKIILKRLEFVEKLKAEATKIHSIITENEMLNIEYSYKKTDLSIKEDLQNQFNKNLDKELELGFTLIGPHRDDLEFSINNTDAKLYASQGQQRTIALVVKLSLMEVIKKEIGEYPVLLLDDVLSELDNSRQNKLIEFVNKFQTLITCTQIPNINLPYNTIKIENGSVKTC